MIRSFLLLLMAETLNVSPLLILSIRDLVWFCCVRVTLTQTPASVLRHTWPVIRTVDTARIEYVTNRLSFRRRPGRFMSSVM